ncbi:MAG: hypothetical protein ACYDGN_10170 [Acidimicrobiales bacterium]
MLRHLSAPSTSSQPDSLRASGEDGEDNKGVEANARLTSATAAVIFVLLVLEGLTILSIRSLVTPHVVIGMILVPPVAVKMGSTSYRFMRYYTGSPEYRRRGPPPSLLRNLGPWMVTLTLLVLGSGIALLFAGRQWYSRLLFLHKATFVFWLGVTALHVFGHFRETTRLAPLDWYMRTRRDVAGAGLRQWLLVGSIAVGLVLAVLVAPQVGPYMRLFTPRR